MKEQSPQKEAPSTGERRTPEEMQRDLSLDERKNLRKTLQKLGIQLHSEEI